MHRWTTNRELGSKSLNPTVLFESYNVFPAYFYSLNYSSEFSVVQKVNTTQERTVRGALCKYVTGEK